ERIQQIKEERERNTEEMGIKRLKQEEKEKEAQNKQREMMIAQPHFEKTKLDRDSLIVQRKELWRTENQQQLALEQLNDEIQKSERMSQGRLGRGAAAGIAAVMKLKSLPGYQDAIYGHLADLIQVKKDNYVAIEVIGGQSLFNVVVRDEHIAAQLVRELQKSNAGRVTFIPLLSINPKRVNKPNDLIDSEAAVASDLIQCEDRIRPAIELIWGRTIVTKDLNSAHILSQKNNVDCCTLQGATVNRKGAMSGGYFDPLNTVLGALADLKELRENKIKIEQVNEETKEQIKQKDNEITKATEEMRKAESQTNAQQQAISNITLEAKQYGLEAEECEGRDKKKSRELEDLQKQIDSLDVKEKSVKAVLESDEGTGKLTEEEREQLSQITSQLPQQRSEASQALKHKQLTERHLQTIIQELNAHITPRLKELNQIIELNRRIRVGEIEQKNQSNKNKKLNNKKKQGRRGRMIRDEDDEDEEEQEQENEEESSPFISSDYSGKIGPLKMAAQAASQQEQSLSSQLADEELKLDEKTAESSELKSQLDQQKEESYILQQNVNTRRAQFEQYLAERSSLQKKQDEYSQRLRDLGAIDPNDMEEIYNMSEQERVRELQEAQRKLKEFTRVNKKALELHSTIAKQQQINVLNKIYHLYFM
ncbi:MAG: putative structural maintenance of chromosomes protein 3, partial [Streblomastix strix]